MKPVPGFYDDTMKPTAPKFSLTAPMRRAGATKVDRTGPQSFAVAFEIEGDDHNAPGKGFAVVEAMRVWAKGRYEILWGGKQAQGVMVITRLEADQILARFRRDVAAGWRLYDGWSLVTLWALNKLVDCGEITYTVDDGGIATITVETTR